MRHLRLLSMATALLLGAISSVEAGYLTLDQAEIGTLGQTFKDPATGSALLFGSTPVGDGVLFQGNLGTGTFPSSGGPASIGIGNSTTTLFGTTDLSAYDTFGLEFRNVDQSWWDVAVYAKTGDGTVHMATAITTVPGDSTYTPTYASELDITGINSDIVELGFIVSASNWAPLGEQSVYPSDPDVFNMQASPVPEPTTMTLMGVAASLGGIRALRRRRRKEQAAA